MPRTFHPTTNLVVRAAIVGAGVIAVGAALAAWKIETSPYVTEQNVPVEQPIMFSHEHHVGGLGIDCRYCHTSVETSPFAGMPPTKTCMTCHSQIWTDAPMLEPVRASWREDKPIVWNKVHNLPDYVYFNHQIHIAKGVGCVSCHGYVNEMPLMEAASPMTMSWCLDCHREPGKHLRPREEIYDLSEPAATTRPSLGAELVERYHIRSAEALTNCSTCHR